MWFCELVDYCVEMDPLKQLWNKQKWLPKRPHCSRSKPSWLHCVKLGNYSVKLRLKWAEVATKTATLQLVKTVIITLCWNSWFCVKLLLKSAEMATKTATMQLVKMLVKWVYCVKYFWSEQTCLLKRVILRMSEYQNAYEYRPKPPQLHWALWMSEYQNAYEFQPKWKWILFWCHKVLCNRCCNNNFIAWVCIAYVNVIRTTAWIISLDQVVAHIKKEKTTTDHHQGAQAVTRQVSLRRMLGRSMERPGSAVVRWVQHVAAPWLTVRYKFCCYRLSLSESAKLPQTI